MSVDDYDLQTLLDDAQDIVDESFVARALLQPETDPWEVCFLCCAVAHRYAEILVYGAQRFPLGLLYPTHDPFNEIHYSSLCDSTINSLPGKSLRLPVLHYLNHPIRIRS